MPLLKHVPMVAPSMLGNAKDVGPFAVLSTARRLGIEPTRLPNGRDLFTFEQAERIAAALDANAKRRGRPRRVPVQPA